MSGEPNPDPATDTTPRPQQNGVSPWGPPSSGTGPSKTGDAGTGNDGDAAKPDVNPWGTPERETRSGGALPTKFDDMLRKPIFGGDGPGNQGRPSAGWLRLPYGLIGLAMLAVWLWTSVHQIGPSERGVVTRLGAFQRVIGPGMTLTAPFPIDRVDVVDSSAKRTLAVPDGSAETLVLTADGNMVDLQTTLNWTIADPIKFRFHNEQPDAMLASITRSAGRAAVVNVTMADILGAHKQEVAVDIRKRIQAMIDSYDMGIAANDVAIRVTAPDALDETSKKLTTARQDNQAALQKAHGDAKVIVDTALAEVATFDKVYEQYQQAPDVTRRRIYYETIENILQKADKTIVAPGVSVVIPSAQRLPEKASTTTSTTAGSAATTSTGNAAGKTASTGESK